MNGNPVTVVRDGILVNIVEDDLHQGDVVVLQAGDMVPADMQLVEARGLEIDEFDVTGEIMPVARMVDDEGGLIYKGSRVTRGTGKGIAVAVGEQSEYGQILKQERQSRVPQRQPLKISRFIAIGLMVPALVFILANSSKDWWILLVWSILSILLVAMQDSQLFLDRLVSREIHQLEKQQIQIRTPGVLVNFHQLKMICFDKTGVITTRNMEVRNFHFPDGTHAAATIFQQLDHNFANLIGLTCALCNDVQYLHKIGQANPIDRAILSFAEQNGMDFNRLATRFHRIYDLPFDSENRYMACGFQEDGGGQYYFAKGDPEIILGMCNEFSTALGTRQRMDIGFWLSVRSQATSIHQKGNSAIALAYSRESVEQTPAGYTFLCLVELENSLHPGARRTMEGAERYGIRNCMLTGDRPESAVRIGMESGLISHSRACMTGRMINHMELSEVARQSVHCAIYAKLIPSQKAILIRLFQQQGYRVAMVGDGPNDAIALKVADIGISFRSNSSAIARKLADVLLNDLTDLLLLLESSHRIQIGMATIRQIQRLILAGSVAGMVGWAFILSL